MVKGLRARVLLGLAATSGLALGVQSAGAQTLYWDINGTTDGAVGDGVTPGVVAGPWDTTTSNWNTDPLGGAAGLVQAWADGNTAVFSAGTNGTVPTSSITLDGTRTVTGLTFEEGAITLTGTANVAIVNLAADAAFNSSSSLITTIIPKITGTGRITKQGTGRIRVTPNNTTALWSGGMQFDAGIWEIAADAGLGLAPASVAAGANNMIFNGGTLSASGGTSISINNNRRIVVNPAGGTFTSIGTGTLQYNGDGLSGTGTLTKRGDNQLLVLGAQNVNYTGKWVVEGGDIQSNNGTDLAFGALPGAYTADAITLNGGGLRHGPTNYTVQANRGITLGAGGGTLRSGNNNNNTLTIDSVITGTGSLTRALFNPATLNSNVVLNGANDYSGGTIVEAATLTITNGDGFGGANAGALTIAAAATARAQVGMSKAVTVASVATTGTGQLDMTDNDLVIKTSTLAAVQAQITSGFNGGTWDGGGINSSSAATHPNATTALGYGDNAELGLTTFSGVALTGPEILVKYTYYGDADLTGVVDLDDFGLFLTGYQNGISRTWIYGDFDYTGVIDLDDFGLFLYGYQNQGGPLSTLSEAVSEASGISSSDRASMQAAIAAVPEPASLGVLAIALAGLAGRRRRA